MQSGKVSIISKVNKTPRPYMAEAKLSDCLTLGHKLEKKDAAEVFLLI